jgi:hypothetical protein
MKADLATARSHPAAFASIVIAGAAVAALALVTIAYLLGWAPAAGSLPSAPGSMASPGQQLAGTVPGGVDLLPGETLVAPAESPKPDVAQTAKPAAPPKPAPPAAPVEAAYGSSEGATRNLCVNCGTVASVGSSGGHWEVRVRFENGSFETLRYAGRPHLRVGEHVRLEDGRLIPE